MRSRRGMAIVCVVCLVLGGVAARPVLQGQTQPADAPKVAVPKELTSYRDVVKKVLPAVVSVEVVSKAGGNKAVAAKPKAEDKGEEFTIPSPSGDRNDDALRKFMEEWMRRGGQMPDATPDPRGHFGSGVLIDPKGIVVTNRHVVNGAGAVEVRLQDGRTFTSKSIAADTKTDLAVVKLENVSNLPYARLGNSDDMEIGDRVLAIGAPFGLAGSVTAGILSGKGRGLGMSMYEDFFQTDAAINPGNSGGPLVNLAGEVVGINTAIATQNGGFQGVGYAIPGAMVKEVAFQLAEKGRVTRGYLGVEIRELSPELAAKLHLNGQKAIEVGKVYPGSPGAKAGFKEEDLIVGVNGSPIQDVKYMQRQIRTSAAGEKMAFDIIRDGKRMSLNVTIEQQPDEYGLARNTMESRRPGQKRNAPETMSLDKLGIDVTDLTPEMADQLGFKDGKGAFITAVEQGSVAQFAGLRRGMTIVRVAEKPIDSAAALKEVVSKVSLEDGVVVTVRTPQGASHRVLIKSTGE